MSDQSEDSEKEEVYYDGDCPMCRNFVARVDSKQGKRAPTANNLRVDSLPEEIEKEEAIRKLHFKDSAGRIYSGAAAVLRLLEREKGFYLFAKLFQLPILIIFAEAAYSLVALNRFFIFGPYKRLYWIKITLALGYLIPFIITRNLWLGETSRFYATTPVASFLPAIEFPLDYIIYTILFLLQLAILLLPNARRYILSFCLLSIIYSLWDQTRWMPYNYQYVFMLLSFYGVSWNRAADDEVVRSEEQRALGTCAIILVSIWAWSGFHKISARYLAIGFPWLISPFTQYLSSDLATILNGLGLVSPVIETGGALLLLFRRTRLLGLFLIVSMHCFILATFGPFGLNFNHSVWSWNLAMIVFPIIIFSKGCNLSTRDIIWGHGLFHKLVLLMFAAMPLLNKVGHLDDFFAHALYSWTTMEAEIEILNDKVVAELPEEVIPSITEHEGRQFIHVLKWSYSVFESPPYHAQRVFESIYYKLCRHVESKESIRLKVYEKPNWATGVSQTNFRKCPKTLE